MTVVIDMLTSRPFGYGLLAGIGGLVIAVIFRRRDTDWGVWWGLATIAVTALYGNFRLEAVERVSRDALWSFPVALLATFGAAYGLRKLSDQWVGGPALGVTLVGIWATVPDTEHAAVLLGVSAGLVWAWWPTFWSKPKTTGAVLVAMLIAWAVLVGGLARSSGIIGGLGVLSSLGVYSHYVRLNNRYVWLLGYTATALVWSRIAGLSDSGWKALLIGGAAWVVVAVLGSRFTESAV